MSLFREPDAVTPPVRFDEREQETEPGQTGLRRAGRKPNPIATGRLTSLRLFSTLPPQMIVDGKSEFVGSDSGLADKAFAKALGAPKIPVHLSLISADASNTVHAHLETGPLPGSSAAGQAEVYVAIALSRAESQVSAGENAGHRLAHASVVRSLTRIGTLKNGQGLAQDVALKLEPGSDVRNLRLIAFIQEPRQGRVLGATSVLVSAK